MAVGVQCLKNRLPTIETGFLDYLTKRNIDHKSRSAAAAAAAVFALHSLGNATAKLEPRIWFLVLFLREFYGVEGIHFNIKRIHLLLVFGIFRHCILLTRFVWLHLMSLQYTAFVRATNDMWNHVISFCSCFCFVWFGFNSEHCHWTIPNDFWNEWLFSRKFVDI